MRESSRLYLIVIILILLTVGLLWTLIEQQPRVSAAPAAAATWTPTPEPTPDWRYTPTPDPNFPVGTKVEAEPPVESAESDERILDRLDNILAALEYLMEREYEQAQSRNPPGTGPTPVAVAADTVTQPAPTPEPQLSIWENGSCWTPADMQVLALCGADAGDGYVIRWRGVAGDSRGPQIPDADYLAVRGGGDRLVWSGHHPATGEAVTVNYWAGGHVLAVHAAGRLLFRIDRNHSVLQ